MQKEFLHSDHCQGWRTRQCFPWWSIHICQSLFNLPPSQCPWIRLNRYVVHLICDKTRKVYHQTQSWQPPYPKCIGIKSAKAEFQSWSDRNKLLWRLSLSHPMTEKSFSLSCAGWSQTFGKFGSKILRLQDLIKPSYATTATNPIISCTVSRLIFGRSTTPTNERSSALAARDSSPTGSIWTGIETMDAPSKLPQTSILIAKEIWWHRTIHSSAKYWISSIYLINWSELLQCRKKNKLVTILRTQERIVT